MPNITEAHIRGCHWPREKVKVVLDSVRVDKSLSIAAIAAIHGVPKDTVWKWARNAGLMKNRKRAQSDAQKRASKVKTWGPDMLRLQELIFKMQ